MPKRSLRSIIFNVLYPLVRLIGDINIGPRNRIVKYALTLCATRTIKHGDVVCTRSRGELTNLFISGPFKHAGIYVSGEIVEATRDGVHTTNVFDFLMSKDSFAVMRPLFKFDDTEVDIAAQRYLGMPYDWQFDSGIEAFTCAELVGQILADASCKAVPFTKRKILGVLSIHPSDFVFATDKFRRVL